MADDHITPTANVLGTIGTVLWCIQLLPQIWKNYRSKSTDGLGAMMLIWAISGVPFGIYAIIQDLNIPIQAQACIFTTLSLITWGQCLYYHNKLALWKSITAPVLLAIIFAGIEVGVILGYGPSHANGNTKPAMVIGIIAAILLAAGLLPPYWEIFQRKGEVVGISFLFLTIDGLGAVFSLLSLVAQKGEFDIVAGVQYGVIILLEAGIMVLGAIWKVRLWARNKNGVPDAGEGADDLDQAAMEKRVQGESEVSSLDENTVRTYTSGL